jgi:NitT/TauT family transport system substrate-binding protein
MLDADRASGHPEDAPLDRPLSRRAFVGQAAFAAATVGFGGSVLTRSAGAALKTRVAQSATGVTVLNILPPQLGFAAEYVADLNGYFKAKGLDVSTQTTRGSAPAIQALIQGQGMLTSIGSMEMCLHNANEGTPLVSIAVREHRAPVALVSSKSNPIVKPQDLAGKKIGIPSAGGTSELTLNTILKKFNIPISSVPRQVTGFQPGTFDLIKAGRIDGFIIGATQMGQFQQLIPESVFLQFGKYVLDAYGYISTVPLIQQNRLTMRSYLEAVRQAMFWIMDDKTKNNYANTLKLLRAHYDFQELQDDKVATSWLDYLVGGWLYQGQRYILEPEVKRLVRIYNQLVDIGGAKAGFNPIKWVNTTVAVYPKPKVKPPRDKKKK